MTVVKVVLRKVKGGGGSGNWGHAGRPGMIGGSVPGKGGSGGSSGDLSDQEQFEWKMAKHDTSRGYSSATSGDTRNPDAIVSYFKPDRGNDLNVGHVAGKSSQAKRAAFQEVLKVAHGSGKNVTISAKYAESMYDKKTISKYLHNKNQDAYYKFDPYASQEILGIEGPWARRP